MNSDPHNLEELGKRLLTSFVRCVSEMVGLDLGPSEIIASPDEPNHTEPIAAIIDFTGTTAGSLLICAEEEALASILGMHDLPRIHERDAERDQCEGLLMEALNVAGGECLLLLQAEERAFITMFSPKILYGTLSAQRDRDIPGLRAWMRQRQ